MHKLSVSYLARWLRARLNGARGAPPAPSVARITQLFRNPAQLRLLARLAHGACRGRPIRVAVWGVADGSEAISLLVLLNPCATDCQCHIDGFDICRELIDLAHAGCYSRAHFPVTGRLPEFADYLTRECRNGEDCWRLREEWRACLRFTVADLTQPLPPEQRAAYDLILCQNIFTGWPLENCRVAFRNLTDALAPGGWLAVGGGPLDVVPRQALDLGLLPVLEDVERIHEGWTVQRRFYDNPTRPPWAIEPFDARHPDGPVRYCTIFRKPTA